MALTIDHKSDQMTKLLSNSQAGSLQLLNPHESHGRVRFYLVNYKNLTGASIAVSKVFALQRLPAGRLLPNSTFYFSAWGTDATLDLGWDDYYKNTGDKVVADIDGIKADLNVAAAGSYVLGTDYQQGIVFEGQWDLVGGSAGAVVPNNATLVAALYVAVD